MDAQAVASTRPFPWRRALKIAAALLALGITGVLIAGFVWLKTYAPLAQGNSYGDPGPFGHIVQPVDASGGIPVFFVHYTRRGIYKVQISIENDGRLAVTIPGPAKIPADHAQVFVPLGIWATHWPGGIGLRPGAYIGPVNAEHPLRLQPGEQRVVDVTYRLGLRCVGGQPKGYWRQPPPHAAYGGVATGNRIGIRIKYARVFERTQQVALPFATELVCRRGTIPTSN